MMIAAETVTAESDPRFGPTVVELTARGATRLSHGPWSLQRHLLSTHALLQRWSQSSEVCLAGLCHSVYATDMYAHRLFARAERERLRALIGPHAERLAYLFSELARGDILIALNRAATASEKAIALRGRTTGETILVTATELGELAIVHIANMAEQGRSADDGPAIWLARCGRLAQAALPYLEVVPLFFEHCSAALTIECERQLLEAYARVWRTCATGEPDPTLSLTACLQTSPCVAEPFVYLGLRALTGSGPNDARACATAAAIRLRNWGIAWDKRLASTQWQECIDFLNEAAALPATDRAFVSQRIEAMFSGRVTPQSLYAHLRSLDVLPVSAPSGSPAPIFAATVSLPRDTRQQRSDSPQFVPHSALRPEAGSPSPSGIREFDAEQPPLPARFAQYVWGLSSNQERPLMGRYPGLPSRAWHDPAAFPLVRALEARATVVCAEIRALRPADFHVESEDIARTGDWNVLMLIERGRAHQEHLAKCPTTAAILADHGVIRGLAGLAYLSRLAPGTDIAPHRGPTNMRLRCHLGISIPPDCGLVVDGVEASWTEGRCLVFDDSLVHAAWNHSKRERLVLVVDVWHPDLTVREIALLEGLHRYAYAHAENLAGYWARNERAGARSAAESRSQSTTAAAIRAKDGSRSPMSCHAGERTMR